MDTLVLILEIVMVVGALAMVVMPLLQPAGPVNDLKNGQPQTPADLKETIFSTLAEIEFDHQMNKLSDEDYQALKKQYQRQALSLLNAEEQASSPAKPDTARAQSLAAEIEAEIEAEVARELSLRSGKND